MSKIAVPEEEGAEFVIILCTKNRLSESETARTVTLLPHSASILYNVCTSITDTM